MPQSRHKKKATAPPDNSSPAGSSQTPASAVASSSAEPAARPSRPLPQAVSSTSDPSNNSSASNSQIAAHHAALAIHTRMFPPNPFPHDADDQTSVSQFLQGLIDYVNSEPYNAVKNYMQATYLVESSLELANPSTQAEMHREAALCAQLRTALINCNKRRILYFDDDDKVHVMVLRYFGDVRARGSWPPRRKPTFEYTLRMLRLLDRVGATREEREYVDLLSRANDLLVERTRTPTAGGAVLDNLDEIAAIVAEMAPHICAPTYRSSYCIFCMKHRFGKRQKVSAG